MNGDVPPGHVADTETVVRRCQRKGCIKVDGTVKRQAFMRTKYPLQISVDREQYCNPWLSIEGDARRTLVRLSVRDVRECSADIDVVAAPPPPPHAHIEVQVTDSPTTDVPSKQDMTVKQWQELHNAAIKLAALATPLERPAT